MSSKYKISNHQALHFITFATVQWVDALSRPLYKDIFIDSLAYCIKSKGLVLYAYVIMSNHVHLIASAKQSFNLSDILRDLKKYTSKAIIGAISNNKFESRRRWLLWIFKSAGSDNSNNTKYQFWQQDNHPIELSTNKMIDQRLDYIHYNPVKEGIVREPPNYVYSSAHFYSGGLAQLPLKYIE